MHVALTADPMLPVPPHHYGGIERIVDMLARGLHSRGHHITIFAHQNSSTVGDLVPWRGASTSTQIDTVRNTLQLARHVTGGSFDVLHSFSRLAYLAPLLPLPIPKLMTYQRPINRRSVCLGHYLSRRTLWFSAVSKEMIEPVADVGRWHVVPNGVPLSVYDFQPKTDPDAPLIFLGRIEAIKGVHLAIDVAQRSGLPLIIAGNIPSQHRSYFDTEVLPRINGKSVKYIGPVCDREKNILLGKAKALIMPILWDEPFGIVMAEAMACGTPVLGLSRGAVPEVVDDRTTGFVCNNLDEMVRAVHAIDKIKRAACRERVEKYYAEDVVVDNYLRIYMEMMDHKERTSIN